MVDEWYGTCLCTWYGDGFGIHVSGLGYGSSMKKTVIGRVIGWMIG
jgi:hypothetical protein